MWIKGKIALHKEIGQNELVRCFPDGEAEALDDQIQIDTNKLPVFFEHKLFIRIINQHLFYRLWVPSMGPMILLLYLSVIFLSGFTTWKMLVVGTIVATGVSFAIYVLNDKSARHYIEQYLAFLPDTEISSSGNVTDQNKCPGCGTRITPYTKICPECGLHNKGAISFEQKNNHTAAKNTKINYHIKT